MSNNDINNINGGGISRITNLVRNHASLAMTIIIILVILVIYLYIHYHGFMGIGPMNKQMSNKVDDNREIYKLINSLNNSD
jgi:hypothetical protein